MRGALKVELLKLRRSTVARVAGFAMAVFLPLMAYSFYSVAINGGVGLLSDKAAAFIDGEGWDAYLSGVNQIAAVAMLLGVGVVVAWDFGREYVDRTFPALFALPVTRSSIATAKFVALTVWLAVVSILTVAGALVVGMLFSIGELDSDLVSVMTRTAGVIFMSALLGLTMGLVASVGRGYLAAVGALIFVVAAAQIAVLFGAGGWFPYAIPGLLAAQGAAGVPLITLGHFVLLVGFVSAIGVVTVSWWSRAEVS